MSKFVRTKLAAMRAQYDNRCRQLAVGAGLLSTVGMAMADTDTFDDSDILLKVAAGGAAAIAISLAFTGAYLGVKASKVPRRGG
jgi:hypothetical protein